MGTSKSVSADPVQIEEQIRQHVQECSFAHVGDGARCEDRLPRMPENWCGHCQVRWLLDRLTAMRQAHEAQIRHADNLEKLLAEARTSRAAEVEAAYKEALNDNHFRRHGTYRRQIKQTEIHGLWTLSAAKRRLAGEEPR